MWLQEFVHVSEEELQEIYKIAETNLIKANETIVKQGQVANKIGLILQGAVRTYYTDNDGNDKIIGFTFEGEPLALIDSFLNKVPSAVTAVTMEPTLIVWTDFERYSAFIQKYPRYNTAMLNALAQWFAKSKERLEYLHQGTAKAKYDKMCKLHPQIIERVPLMYIASYLGITQHTLSRIRGKK